ncbi:MAG: polymer-forming cytoskeletal protein [Chloroflexi bacterium]|jgi:hypothetical protein|nr:polymer-forming cytoskeletal protein [Chloroflexota bacterium]
MRRAAFILCLVLCSALITGCLQVNSSPTFTLENGDTVRGNLLLFSSNAVLEENSQVTGSVWLPRANLRVDGNVGGDIFVLIGSVDLGASAAVNGDVMVVSGSIQLSPEARTGGQVGYGVTPGFIADLVVWLCLLPVALTGLFLFLITLGLYRGRRPEVRAEGGERRPTYRRAPGILAGAVLVLLGGLLLLNNILGFLVLNLTWPWLIVFAGALCLLLAASGRGVLSFLAIPASILVLLGLTFLYQSTFDHYESWAYAWALVGITGTGLGIWLMGLLNDEGRLMNAGTSLAALGLVIFVVAAFFFEQVLNISGQAGDPGTAVFWPVALILLGFLLLLAQFARSQGTRV